MLYSEKAAIVVFSKPLVAADVFICLQGKALYRQFMSISWLDGGRHWNDFLQVGSPIKSLQNISSSTRPTDAATDAQNTTKNPVMDSWSILLENLSSEVTSDVLMRLLSHYGRVVKIHMLYREKAAIVVFSTLLAAENVFICLQGKVVYRQPLRIIWLDGGRHWDGGS